MDDSIKSAESNNGSLNNGLTSDVLRARALEYYNSCHSQMSRQLAHSTSIHKSGSMTHINGYINGINPSKFAYDSRSHYNDNSNIPYSGNRSLHGRSDRPHRTHSERANRSPGEHGANYLASSHHSNSQTKVGLYRSNSSLDLDHNDDIEIGALRRDYGSASSLDMISTTGESFFAMLREFKNENLDQRSPGPSKIHEFLRGKIDPAPSTQNASNALANGSDSLEDSQSPKLKTKFHKLWEIKDKGKIRPKMLNSEPSLFKKLRGTRSDINDPNNKGTDSSLDAENRLEEKLRKKAFAHHDCQSITANLSYASRLRNLLSKRRNTTTGASAASLLNRTSNNTSENLIPEIADSGDGKNNDLVLSCPFFRNELGGEDERIISLSRITCQTQKSKEEVLKETPTLHRPSMACGLSILENANTVRWKHRSCPYQRPSLNIENIDSGALYYRQFLFQQEHQNWFGVDENLGPVAISIKREKVEPSGSVPITNIHNTGGNISSQSQYLYRLVIRTSELSVMRGTVLEEAIPSLSRSNPPRGIHSREVLEYVAPEIMLPCLKLGIPTLQTEEQLLRLDEQGLNKTYKVGIMYCKAGQSTEEEMYNNEHSGPAFEEFLEMLGQRVRLKGFDKYRAGLDNKTDTTGLYSIYATYQDCEIMFHVSTLLPHSPNNRQQLLRKRHIGNDIVTIIFQEPDAQPFTPKHIRSHFQHAFIIIRAINPCTDSTRYRLAVSRSKEVAVFGPPIPDGATFPKSKAFSDFLLSKVINAENAAHRSEKFATMAQRTRQEYLKDLAMNYSTNTTIDSGPKFSILSFGGKKKERSRPRFIPDNIIQGAISWQVQVEDFGLSAVVDCILGISVDTLVLIEEINKEIVFVAPCSAVIGWSSHTSSLKIFYHQGECLVLRTKDPDVDEVQEIVSRLACVTQGCETQELILRRNSLGQLGFHVQFEGIITEVENYGFAWQAGLRQGSRLVEICKVAVSTLSYDQMVDLLKTSMTVTVTVIPPFQDGSSRKGCALHNCSYLSTGSLSDYENISSCNFDLHKVSTPSRQQLAHHSQKALIKLENHSNSRHINSKNSGDSEQRLTRIETNSQQSESRRDSHQIHHSLLSNRGSQENPPTVPGRLGLNTYAPIPSISPGDKHSSPPMSSHSTVSTPRSSPSRTGSTSHDHSASNYSSQSHLHRSFHDHNRNSNNQRMSHGTGMVAARSELSLTEITPFHTRSHSHHLALSSSARPNKVAIDNFTPPVRIPQNNNGKSWSPSSSRQGEWTKSSTKRSPPATNSTDYHSDSSSDWHQGASSADELSGESCLSSPPHGHNRHAQNSYTETSGKEPSPRVSRTQSEAPYSKANRLRPGVTSSSRTNKLANAPGTTSSGSSCSGSTSTLQEDLLKLISPDFLDSDSNSEDPASSHFDSETGSQTQPSTPYSSLERNGSVGILASSPDHDLDTSQPSDVIVTKAQPVQVISSEPSSPAPAESRLSRDERLSPRVTSDRVLSKLKSPPPPPPPPPHSMIPLPEGRDIDWPSLVDTATKAIEGIPASKSWIDDNRKEQSNNLQNTATQHIHDLESKVHRLQQDLAREQIHKVNLEQQVQQLREENQRLQEESQSATSQLRKFREWLLHNRDMQ